MDKTARAPCISGRDVSAAVCTSQEVFWLHDQPHCRLVKPHTSHHNVKVLASLLSIFKLRLNLNHKKTMTWVIWHHKSDKNWFKTIGVFWVFFVSHLETCWEKIQEIGAIWINLPWFASKFASLACSVYDLIRSWWKQRWCVGKCVIHTVLVASPVHMEPFVVGDVAVGVTMTLGLLCFLVVSGSTPMADVPESRLIGPKEHANQIWPSISFFFFF